MRIESAQALTPIRHSASAISAADRNSPTRASLATKAGGASPPTTAGLVEQGKSVSPASAETTAT